MITFNVLSFKTPSNFDIPSIILFKLLPLLFVKSSGKLIIIND